MESHNVKRRLTCILAADAVAYSSHMALDEEGTVRILAAHRAVIDGIIAFHDGRIVGTAGDSVLAEFASAVSAVRCASEIQEAIKTRNDALPQERRLMFRVGVNLGDVVVQNQDLLGDGVNIASRLETLAEPGGICISSSVYDQITGKLNLGFLDIGEQSLKNIGRPVRVYRISGVQPPGVARSATPAAGVGGRGVLAMVASAVGAVGLAGALAWSLGWLRPAPSPLVAMPGLAPMPAPAAAPAIPPEVTPAADAVPVIKEPRPQPSQAVVTSAAPKAATQGKPTLPRPVQAADPPAPVPQTPVVSPTPVPVAVPVPVPLQTPAAPAGATPYDGQWLVTVRCGGGPGGAEGYAVTATGSVEKGWFRAERNAEAGVNTLRLEGAIGADGKALLTASGTTGDPRYAMNRVRPGTGYGYEVAAQFDANSGHGIRTGVRRCELSFDRR